MKKSFMMIYIGLFAVMICLPAVLMPFFKNDAGLEKREPAPFPAYIAEEGLNLQFSDQFEDWLNDRLPLRAKLLTVSNGIFGGLLHGQTANVIAGKDGWLFYNVEADDYMDINAMTKGQISAAAITLSLMEENVRSRGGRFSFVPVPNKSEIYNEYMPDNYLQAKENNLTRLGAELKKEGVTFTDLRQVLTDAKQKGVYHRRDSHWNYRGALIGRNAIMDSLKREHDTYNDAPYTIRNTWRGDLEKLLYPAGGIMDEQIYYDIDFAPFKFTQPMGIADTAAALENFMSDREDRDTLISAKNSALKDGSSLFMVRDSFGRALLPFMIDSYENTTFKRADRPDLASVADGTDVIYEIAQRNLSRIIETAPFMYAPERSDIIDGGLKDGGTVEVHCEALSYGLRLYGELPDMENAGRVYLRLEQNGRARTFEAFPICERALLNTEGTCGYSAYLSKDLGLSGEYRVSVIADNNIFQCGMITV